MFSEVSTGAKPKVQWNENVKLQPWDFKIRINWGGKRIVILCLLKISELFACSVEGWISYAKSLAKYVITNSDKKSWQ